MHKSTPILNLLLALGGPLTAQITADIHIVQAGGTLGTISVELDHVNAPMATANFIGLATGKFAWIDSATGVVRQNTPYYDGIVFHRVIAGFMNQTGSRNGLGTDGPGYRFQDGVETTNGLDHSEPYVLSMANSGIDTNGSQFFITVEPTPWLDGKHIVFGKVPATDIASRSVVNQINNLPTDASDRPVNEVWIESVTVNSNGVDFDPCAQKLPVVSSPALQSPITPSTTFLEFTQPAGSTFHLAYTDDLANWSRTGTSSLDIGDSPVHSFPLPGVAIGNELQFFSPALVTYNPDFLIPQDVANRTLAVVIPDSGHTTPITFNFNAGDADATWAWPGVLGSGTAVFFDDYSATINSGFMTLDLSGSSSLRYWRFNRLRPTASTPHDVSGLAQVFIYGPTGAFLTQYAGTFTLTK